MRTAPRDALIADATPSEQRGRAFGFNKAMDKVGAVAGLVFAAALVFITQEGSVTLTHAGYQTLVLLAVVPGLGAVVVLALAVKERSAAPPLMRQSVRLTWAGLGGRFRGYLAIIACFTLGNSSDAFLMLRAQTLGLTTVEIFLMLAAFSAVIALRATPAGALSDLVGGRALIIVGWSIYAAIYLGFAVASARWHIWALYLGYGLYYGAFQGGQRTCGRPRAEDAAGHRLWSVQRVRPSRCFPGQRPGGSALAVVRAAGTVLGRRRSRLLAVALLFLVLPRRPTTEATPQAR